RRKLLELVISKVLQRGSSGDSFDFSAVDLDTISVDYVLECVQSGGGFDPLEASKKYYEEWDFPIMMNSSSGNSFFLHSKPELSGSPPRRAPPQIGVPETFNHSCRTERTSDLADREIGKSGIEIVNGDFGAIIEPRQLVKDVNILSLGLPALRTGLSDDDMRETAYEVLLGSLILSGRVLIPRFEEKKKEKKSRLTVGIRSKKDDSSSREQSEDDHSDLLDVIRGQMEISETMDACIKHGLRLFCANIRNGRTDVPQIALELLDSICKSHFPNQRSYTHWLKRQANILEELLSGSDTFVADEHTVLSSLLAQLKNVEEWESICPDEHAEILSCVKGFASRLSSSPPKFGIPNECYYWTHSYHFNIKLYEKLLNIVFDVLEDGQIVEEAEDILKILQLTWPVLGVTQKMHNALYGWLLFQKFVLTGEHALLKYAVFKVQKILSNKDDGGSEEAYINSLICSIEVCGSSRNLKLVDSVLLNIFAWCSFQLEDYHLHFDQDRFHTLERVLTMAILTGSSFLDEYGENQFFESMAEAQVPFKLVHIFTERSIQAAYKRVLNSVDAPSEKKEKHPLIKLANELKIIAEKEFTSFTRVLGQQYPNAGVVSSLLLHHLYGEKLNPFLKGVLELSENVQSVLAASDSLELYLADVLNSVCQKDMKSLIVSYWHPYQIREVCAPLILHWLNAQHENILEWTKRAIQLEDWEPLSSQQRQAASIIEVFRIIEEAIDQFFDLNLPMDIIQLRSLLIGIFRCLDAYLLHIVNQQVDKSTLYPSPPALTRYKESLNPFTKKKSADGMILEGEAIDQLNNLTLPKLCVKLNTLYYIREQLDALEDDIQQSWIASQSVKRQSLREVTGEAYSFSESIDELFTIFDDIRRSAINASNVLVDFTGVRIIFWDMRDSFLSSLYRGNVGSARMEKLVPELDTVLDDICGLVIDTLRDHVVLSICQASMNGYVWVLLDGGPSRAFSETDVTMMQEDLNILKDFFVADGQGLPLSEVEKASGLPQQIIGLYGMKSSTIIDMLRNASNHISHSSNPIRPGNRSARDADTLLRVLCHKKDDDASEFLKLHYQLPKSSDYDDFGVAEQTSTSPLLPGILNRNVSINWSEQGQKSFSMMRKKFQEAASEVMQTKSKS
ncbi:uncharacterized protein LOC109825902, partial [Asparagus officinalis]|uniref:uncharacterized protein LOC109825902 n=1 Tax=Asparagus officinalis TaxID=4686 RepID=UPI00098DE91F